MLLLAFIAWALGAPVSAKGGAGVLGAWAWLQSGFSCLPLLTLAAQLQAVAPPQEGPTQLLSSQSFTGLVSLLASPRERWRHRSAVWPGLGALLGAWAGALVVPLDWGTAWQVWPVSSVYGGVTGLWVGHLLSIITCGPPAESGSSKAERG
jgi:hypothetical protein